jgi:Ca2+-binding RTX toxin-like protein
MFKNDGSKDGGEFLVNTTTISEQHFPAITALTDGRFVIAWSDFSRTDGDTSYEAVRAQVFNANGTKDGKEFLVNTTTVDYQWGPAIASLEDGRFVITWSTGSADMTYPHFVQAQVFNADGSKAGEEIVVNPTMPEAQDEPTIATLADGRFVIAWTHEKSWSPTDAGYQDIRAQVFNADGTKSGRELLVNTSSVGVQSKPKITALADGRFVIAWSDFDGGQAQLFNIDGSKEGSIFQVTNSNSDTPGSITTLADGRFVITNTNNASFEDVRARIFDPRTSAIDLTGTLDDDNLIGTIFNDTLSGFFGNDSLRGAAGHDKLYGEDDNDSLIGNAGNDLLDGATGDDDLRGGPGSDRLTGGSGNDSVDGQAGNDLLAGGSGDDILVIDTLGDRVVEAAGGGIDEVRSATVSIDLNLSHLTQVENARLTGHLTLHLTGSSTANRLTGNEDPNTIRGNAGSDILTGLAGADRFVLSDALQADQITDFTSASDKLQLSKAGLPIGNGNTTIDGGLLRNAPGGFSTAAELVIFSSNIASPSITTTNAAAAIGSATAAYTVGATRLFAVDNGSRSHLYRFRAADANALVAPSELTLLADLSATPALALADLQFIL